MTASPLAQTPNDMFNAPIAQADPEIAAVLDAELSRQQDGLARTISGSSAAVTSSNSSTSGCSPGRRRYPSTTGTRRGRGLPALTRDRHPGLVDAITSCGTATWSRTPAPW